MLDEETQQPEDLNEAEETTEETSEEDAGNADAVEQPTEGRQRRDRAAARGGRSGDVVLEAPTEPPPSPRLYEQLRTK